MRHLNFPKTQPLYNPEEQGVNPRYPAFWRCPPLLPLSCGRSRLARAAGTTWITFRCWSSRVWSRLALCVHGTSTWSYLWRTVLMRA